MIIDDIRKNIENEQLIISGDVVILGLSGGPDSMCLMENLYRLKDEKDFRLVFAHISHGFRPVEGKKDMEFVKQVGEKYQIETFIKEVECSKIALEKGVSDEEAGRMVRYEFFNEIETAYIAKGYRKEQIKIAIAHNMGDQSETILFRIIRGTGIDGIAGIEYKSINHRGSCIIRPMLNVPRQTIEEYCRKMSLNPRKDETNEQDVYTRNKIRLKLIPYINEMFGIDVNNAIFNLGENAKSDKEYLWQKANEIYKEALIEEVLTGKEKKVVFEQSKLEKNHGAILQRVMLKAFRKIGLDKDIARSHINDFQKIIKIKNNPKELNLPQGFSIEVAYGKVTCIKRRQSGEITLIKKEFSCIKDYESYIESKKKAENFQYAAFDLDKIKEKYAICENFENIQMRKRKAGDFIRLKGMKGRKKIQDLMVDMKVPRQDRENINLVSLGNEILWIVSEKCKYRKNCEFTLDNGTKHIILLEIQGVLC